MIQRDALDYEPKRFEFRPAVFMPSSFEIIKKRLGLNQSLYIILQISQCLTFREKAHFKPVQNDSYETEINEFTNQLNLWEI